MTRSRPPTARVATAVLRDRGRLTLPEDVRRSLGLADGDTLLLLATERGIEMVPASVVPRDQLWTCVRRVRAGLAESARQADAGLLAFGGAGPTGPSPAVPDADLLVADDVAPGCESVVLTERFRRRFERLTPRQRDLCRASLRRLRRDPGARSLRTRAVPGSEGVLESRFAYRGRILHRSEGGVRILLDVYGPREIASLERRAATGVDREPPEPESTPDP